ncbi:MAG: DNA polymerase IV [Clostridia bacterium]|nr:DNA polymerase IV [Clostridia bacterium]
MEHIILHSDLNNFFASVEAVKNPLLRGKCFAVAGDPEKRHGIILAKSQEAKKLGIRTGETIWEARQKCKDLILVKPDMPAYHHYSKLVHEIYRRYTDKIEPFGIDEAWLDVSGSTRLFGCGAKIAYEIRQKIKEELGMTVSIGVSYNKIFAKLGSDLKKPDATTVISKENFKSVVHPLPVSDLLFVGRSTKEKLHQHGIRTIGDLAETDPDFLKLLLGKIGISLYQYAIGSEQIGTDVLEPPEVKSISNSVTSSEDLATPNDVRMQLMLLAEQVSSRMRHKHLHGTLITLFIRDTNFRTITRQRNLPLPTNNAAEIANECYTLFQQNYDLSVPIRCIGLGVSKLTPDSGDLQLTLWDLNNERVKEQTLDQTVDQLRDRYGFNCIVRGGCLHQHLKNYTVPNEPGEVSSFCTLPGCHI